MWVAQNKSRTERNRSKVVSTLKIFLTQLGEYAPQDVVVNYKTFKVMVRDGGKMVPVAVVSSLLDVKWLDDNPTSEAVKEALTEVIADLEWGWFFAKTHGHTKFVPKTCHNHGAECVTTNEVGDDFVSQNSRQQ